MFSYDLTQAAINVLVQDFYGLDPRGLLKVAETLRTAVRSKWVNVLKHGQWGVTTDAEDRAAAARCHLLSAQLSDIAEYARALTHGLPASHTGSYTPCSIPADALGKPWDGTALTD